MRQLLLSLIRRRAGMRGESQPRPDDGYERVLVDSNQEIVIDGVAIGTARLDPERGSGNPLKFVLWIIMILILGASATGYFNNFPERLQDFIEELRRPSSTLPGLPETRSGNSPQNAPLSDEPASNDASPDDPAPNDPLSKKNTH